MLYLTPEKTTPYASRLRVNKAVLCPRYNAADHINKKIL
jgi:hypothetical protein